MLQPDLGHLVAGNLRHRAADLTAIDVKSPLRARFAGSGSAIQGAASDQNHLRAERKRLHDVAAAAHAAVEENGRAIADGLHDVRQHFDRGGGGVAVTSAMVGHDDAVRAMFE